MLSSYNGVSQLTITKFINDIDVSQQNVIVGKNNIYTANNISSIEVYLPESEFYNILPGAIITSNNQSRYLLTKPANYQLPATLNSSVNWYNSGTGYPFTYRNPISQILSESNDVIGYITSDNKIYLTINNFDFDEEINTEQISSQSNGLKLLNSNGYGIYIAEDGTIYKGNSNTNTWENIGGISDADLANIVLKTDTDVSGNTWVLDEDSMTSNSNEKLPTQQSLKSFVDDKDLDGGAF